MLTMIVLQVKRTNSKLIKQLAEFEARGEFEKSKCESEGEGSEVQHMQGNIQALLKIIISQRETIQSQLGTLKVLENQKEKKVLELPCWSFGPWVMFFFTKSDLLTFVMCKRVRWSPLNGLKPKAKTIKQLINRKC